MTNSPRIPAPAGPPQVRPAGLAWPGSRYRHPGQVIRLLAASMVLAVTAAIAALGPASLLSHGGGPVSGTAAMGIIAGLAAAATAAGPWLSRPWRRTAWVTLLLICAVLVITGGLPVLELVLALAAGVAGGTGFLAGYGVPDRRLGPAGVAAALRTAGVPVRRVAPAAVTAKGSRPFRAETDAGPPLFVKVFGRDNRDADLLYRAYRAIRLRGVGDSRPASSLARAVEHEALLAVLAERAGAAVPRVGQIIKAGDGSVLLTMEYVAGQPLDAIPAGCVTDRLARDVWHEVAVLHQAGIAHRSLRGANIVVADNGCPRIVDFSFAELAATARHLAIDVAELLTSLASQIGPARAVGSALPELGRAGVASAVPLLQPLALSAGTRRGIKGQDGLLKQTRATAMAASGELASPGLARLQRVRPRTLLTIAALAGAFYYLLPQIAEVSNSWHALLNARWGWLPVLLLLSALTYLASALALIGAVPGPVPLGPAVAAQGASSFINRVSPANVGGMALNARFLQKSGADTAASVAAVGVNSLAGAVMHLLLMVLFFALARHDLSRAFKLPSGSKLLLILAVLLALAGLVLATRPGRRWTRKQLIPGLRSAAVSLQRVTASPAKMILLFGGSALITLAYIGGLAVSVEAFSSRGPSLAVIGAVYLGAAALAAAAPTPGGLGAIEAALIAGLMGVGLAAGPAVSAVLLYRLATYWLPILPGWLSWRWLQRKEYL